MQFYAVIISERINDQMMFYFYVFSTAELECLLTDFLEPITLLVVVCAVICGRWYRRPFSE